MEPAGVHLAVPRGLLPVGGFTIARHQLTVAIALECQRVIVFARDFSPGMVDLQHHAEKAGLHFHVISGARPLSGLVSAHDELFVFSDGLLAAPQEAEQLLGQGPCVLVQPVEQGMAAGFERIDINHATAGAMRVPGRLAERLAELPGDCDVASALTRIALQAGIRQEPLPLALRDSPGWRLIRDEAEAHMAEAGWIRLHLGDVAASAPGPLLAQAAIRRFGPGLLHAGSGSRGILLAAGGLLLVAIVASWYGHPVAGFVLLALAWLARGATALLARVERDSVRQPGGAIPREELFGWLTDALLVLFAVWNAPILPGQGWQHAAFAPVMLIGVLRLVAPHLPRAAAAWASDRLVLYLLAALAAFGEVLHSGIMAAAVLAAMAGLSASAIARRITRP